MSTNEDALSALHEIQEAAERLAERGLTTADGEARGITADGLQVLADLCTVLMLQGFGGRSPAEKVAGAAAQAMLNAVGDLFAYVAGTPTDGTETLKFLAAATKTARDVSTEEAV